MRVVLRRSLRSRRQDFGVAIACSPTTRILAWDATALTRPDQAERGERHPRRDAALLTVRLGFRLG
jgi:hypothetical protein